MQCTRVSPSNKRVCFILQNGSAAQASVPKCCLCAACVQGRWERAAQGGKGRTGDVPGKGALRWDPASPARPVLEEAGRGRNRDPGLVPVCDQQGPPPLGPHTMHRPVSDPAGLAALQAGPTPHGAGLCGTEDWREDRALVLPLGCTVTGVWTRAGASGEPGRTVPAREQRGGRLRVSTSLHARGRPCHGREPQRRGSGAKGRGFASGAHLPVVELWPPGSGWQRVGRGRGEAQTPHGQGVRVSVARRAVSQAPRRALQAAGEQLRMGAGRPQLRSGNSEPLAQPPRMRGAWDACAAWGSRAREWGAVSSDGVCAESVSRDPWGQGIL